MMSLRQGHASAERPLPLLQFWKHELDIIVESNIIGLKDFRRVEEQHN